VDPVQDAIELTRRLIQLPSESSGHTLSDVEWPERKVGEFLLHVLEGSGFKPFTFAAKGNRHNVIARYPGDGPRLLLVGHMDTVSAGGMQEPFAASLRDGRIWGRGACDDKGPLAAAIAVLRWMQEQKSKCFFDLFFAASVDEECTLAGAGQLANWIEYFDLCIAMEPTGLKIVRGHKGDLRLKITTSGKSTHSSSPELGDNAVEKILSLAAEMDKYKEQFAALPDAEPFGKPTLAITSIHGGSSSNMIPDSCSMTVDCRLLPEMEPQSILNKIQADIGARAEIEVLFAGSGMLTDYDHSLVQRLASSILRENEDPGPACVSFATDCSRLVARGPCIVWGPGNIAQAHHQAEYIEIAALEKAVRILQKFLCA